MEQRAIADQYDFSKNWWEQNATVLGSNLSVFKCPSAMLPAGGYASVDGPTRDDDSAVELALPPCSSPRASRPTSSPTAAMEGWRARDHPCGVNEAHPP